MSKQKRILHGDTSGVCYSCLNGDHENCDYQMCKCRAKSHVAWWWKTQAEIDADKYKDEIKTLYHEWCKETKRNGGVLVGGSMYEFFDWLKQRQITLQFIMEDVAEFSDKTFGKERPFTAPLHHLQKEIKEVCEADDFPFEDEGNGSLIEFADCLLLLLDAFRKRHRDLTAGDLLRTCKNKMINNRKRKWGDPDENGVIEHIRD